MKNMVVKSIVLSLVAAAIGLSNTSVAEARHWHHGWYGGGHGYYSGYYGPAYGPAYGAYNPGWGGWGHRGWYHHSHPIGASVRVW